MFRMGLKLLFDFVLAAILAVAAEEGMRVMRAPSDAAVVPSIQCERSLIHRRDRSRVFTLGCEPASAWPRTQSITFTMAMPRE